MRIVPFLLAVVMCPVTWGTEIKVPFLYTEDQRVESVDLEKSIKSSKELEKDDLLNRPVTRVEFILVRLEKSLKEGLKGFEQDFAREFEKSPLKYSFITMDSGINHLQKTGKIYVFLHLRDVGRPKRPLSSICNTLLDSLEHFVPQKSLGRSYRLEAFRPFVSADADDAWEKQEHVFANNVVQIASITSISSTAKGNALHSLSCLREKHDAKIKYNKDSRYLYN